MTDHKSAPALPEPRLWYDAARQCCHVMAPLRPGDEPMFDAADMHAHAASATAELQAQVEALRKDAERYRWLRDCLWTQELNAYSKGRTWLWSTRFASSIEAGGDLDVVTQAQELDAAIDAAMQQAQEGGA